MRRHSAEEAILAYLRENALLEQGMHVCVCFSGGVDSSVLLHLLFSLREELGLRLSACHFHHGIRGEEADRDEAFCASVCRELDIPLYHGAADVPALVRRTGKSPEEAARDARYDWFAVLGKKEGIDRFATAHHKNDQAETVLFRLLRGTTVAGLRGIPPKRGDVIRPLLCLSRGEIEAYAREHGIAYCTDVTNFSEKHTRNYIRMTLLPAMERVNPAATEAILRLSRYASEDEDALSAMLPPHAVPQQVAGLPAALLRRVVARNFTLETGKTLCYTHLDELCRAVATGKDGFIGLPGGYRAVLSGGTLRYEAATQEPLPPLDPGVLREGTTLLCGGALRVTMRRSGEPISVRPSPDGEFVYNLSIEIPLSCSGICGMIRYRCRQNGDRLRVRGVNRSVKKLFSESKIPVPLRERIPVFYDDKGVFCIPFVGVADRAYVQERRSASFILQVEIADRLPERW
ncbi:MAG: tRNA lysidine(34) synthetase TilS [Oscillospiraceae bacterium]|nr:tRNA lysidine(34) synthetase TilS [Oscillospiraceae bacterium]